MKNREFWTGYQPGFRFAEAQPGTREFFDQVAEQRYALEPHIPEVVDFSRWAGCRVLEAGSGVGTDGARFAAAGAHYTGIDFSPSAVGLARKRFEYDGHPCRFVSGSVTNLPFADESFDLVFSHGVIHHVADTERAVAEFRRVLRPGGTVLVMLYHRRSLNYYLTLMALRRALVGLLLLPKGVEVVSRITGEPEDVLAGHRGLLRAHGLRYISDRSLFLSHNTDGPGNPLSKVYSRAEGTALLAPYFRDVRTDVRYLNLRLYPGGERLVRSALGSRLERRIGWHLYITGVRAPRAGAASG